MDQGRIQDFLKGGSRKESGVQPQKLLGFVLLNIKMIHFEHNIMFKQISNQVSVASYSYMISAKINHWLGFQG